MDADSACANILRLKSTALSSKWSWHLCGSRWTAACWRWQSSRTEWRKAKRPDSPPSEDYKQWCWKKYLETTRCANLIIWQSKTYPDWPRRILDVIQNVLQHDRLKIFSSTITLNVSLHTHGCKELEEHGDWDKKKWNQEPGSSKPPSSPVIENKIVRWHMKLWVLLIPIWFSFLLILHLYLFHFHYQIQYLLLVQQHFSH